MCGLTARFRRLECMPDQRGLTLLEMILFIVVIGIAGVVLLTVMTSPMTGAGTQLHAVTAAQVAQARTEVVLGQKRRDGFPGRDPCETNGFAFCTVPNGWSVDTTFEAWSENSDTDNYQVVVVTATDPDGGTHTVRTLVTRLGD